MKRPEKICVVNQKGGVGKTTSSVNISAGLARLGKKVLFIDMDPQANGSSGLGLKGHDCQKAGTYQLLIGKKTVEEVLYPTAFKNLFVIPAVPDLVGAEIELVNESRREYRLDGALKKLHHGFDFIFMDCPPSLNLLTLNALVAARSFLVPLQCEYYALEGLSQLLYTAGLVRKNFNPDLKMEGILLTMFDKRNNLSHQVVDNIRGYFKEKVFETVIPRNVRLSESPSHGQPIFEYDPKSVGAFKYMDLCKEVLELKKQDRSEMTNQMEAHAHF